MTITTETTASATIVSIEGQINSANATAMEAQVQAIIDGGARGLVFDFSALDYISSAGLRVVLMVAKRARQSQGRLLLCSLPPQVREVFEISGFLKILDVAPDPVAAVEALS